jgi:hypothetical protein
MGDGRGTPYWKEVRYGRTPGPGFGQKSRRGATVEDVGKATMSGLGTIVQGLAKFGEKLWTDPFDTKRVGNIMAEHERKTKRETKWKDYNKAMKKKNKKGGK